MEDELRLEVFRTLKDSIKFFFKSLNDLFSTLTSINQRTNADKLSFFEDSS